MKACSLHKNGDDSYKAVIALVGNPNVGKSTVFNALTGLHQHTGNWPGKTVDTAMGSFRGGNHRYKLVDLPGTYSLHPQSQEEEITRDYILSGEPDAVIAVCDATCLERNLILVLQLLDVTKNVIVCVNLMDEAERKGIRVNVDVLSKELNVPVIGVSAKKKKTLDPLRNAAAKLIDEIQIRTPSEIEANPPRNASETAASAKAIASDVIRYSSPDHDRIDRRIDRMLTGPYGFVFMGTLLLFLLWLTIRGSNYPSELLSRVLFQFGDTLSSVLMRLQTPEWIQSALIDGIYRILAWVVSVMLPPMAIFFPLFTLLEDVGFLPRIAFNLDCPFQRCHACGKQALTMTMGIGCNAVGVVGCRIIDSPREKMLAMLTNSFIPCNGRFPMLIALLSVFFAADSSFLKALMLSILLILAVASSFGATKLLSSTMLKGTPSSFLLELPPYRRPQVIQILTRSLLDRTLFVLGRAVAVAAPAGLLLWILRIWTPGGRDLLQTAAAYLDPIGRWLGMDGVILLAFILGSPANETVIPIMLMIYLSGDTLVPNESLSAIGSILIANGWTWSKALCVLLFTMMHWPCTTTLLTIHKETQSLKWTAAAAVLPAVFGAAACFTVHMITVFAAL